MSIGTTDLMFVPTGLNMIVSKSIGERSRATHREVQLN